MQINNKPDYKSYSYDQLIDVKNHVDKEKYPDRYSEVCGLLEKMDKPNVIKPIKKKRRKLTISDHVIFGIISLLVIVYQVWSGHTIGRHGGFSMQDQPIIFWFFNGLFVFAFVSNVVHIAIKLNKSKNA